MNKPGGETPAPSTQGSVFTTALRIFGVVPHALSVLLSFAVVAYVVGWFQARAYFGSFGAEWLATQLNAVDLLRFSWTPILLLVVFMWFGLTDLAETGERKDSKRFQITLFIVRYGWVFLLALGGVASPAFQLLGYPFLALALAAVTMFGYVLFAGAAFEAIVMRVREGQLVADFANAHLVAIIVVAGLFFVPTLYGRVQGRIAADPTRSDLPVVHVARASGQHLRLLLLSQGTVYAADLGDGTRSQIKIHVLPISELQAVMPKPGVAEATSL
ncbi:MAG: hypothetical protein ACREBC_14375 [Pyrinomonadaceae bacterium]